MKLPITQRLRQREKQANVISAVDARTLCIKDSFSRKNENSSQFCILGIKVSRVTATPMNCSREQPAKAQMSSSYSCMREEDVRVVSQGNYLEYTIVQEKSSRAHYCSREE